jgi:hypothetical protein
MTPMARASVDVSAARSTPSLAPGRRSGRSSETEWRATVARLRRAESEGPTVGDGPFR